MDSAAPTADSLFLRQMRVRLKAVKRELGRPTVALVLSGGGAKGAAQVGALMYLQELGIPVDFVCGTSIGGLLGGLYALGYTPEQMQELFTTQDWGKILTDAVDQKYIPYSTKMYNTRYVASIPFHTASELLEMRKRDTEEYERQSFISSLPSGYAYGFNVNNLISSLTVGYHDEQSFARFPLPFVCVASDVISCKAKNWGSGELKTAMRSTMSIPGLFDPVRTGEMVLVDGGTRNNFPTDIAKAVGADYIIGIELSDLMPEYNEVNNIGDIIMQFFTMLSTDAYNKNVSTPDVFIKPDLQGYNMLSFSDQAVDSMIVRGYEAAKAKTDELLNLKSKLSGADPSIRGRKAIDISKRKVSLKAIEFEGISDEESKMLSRLLPFSVADLVGKEEMDDAMSRFQATGAFSSLTYSLLGSEEPFRLVFHCQKSPTHSFGLGFRMDTEEWASIALNLGLNTNTLMGSRLNLSAKLGQNLKAGAHYSFDLVELPTVNFEAEVSRTMGNLGTGMDETRYDVSYWSHKELLYLTDVRWTKLNFKIGLRNQYNNVDGRSYLGSQIAAGGKDALKADYMGLFLKGNYYTLDDYYFPTKGVSTAFNLNYDFAKLGYRDFRPVLALGLDFKASIKASQAMSFIPEIHLRNIFNSPSSSRSDTENYHNLSILHSNFAGGSIAGRYTEGQIPFFGIGNVVITSDQLVSATLEMRVRAWKKMYLSAMAGILESNTTIEELALHFSPDYYAFGLQAGYNLSGMPLKLNLHWNQVHKWGIHISLGYDF